MTADHDARDAANKAILLIEGHEKVCTERQEKIMADLHDIKGNIASLYSRFWAAALGVIGLLLTSCGGLLWICAKLLAAPHLGGE